MKKVFLMMVMVMVMIIMLTGCGKEQCSVPTLSEEGVETIITENIEMTNIKITDKEIQKVKNYLEKVCGEEGVCNVTYEYAEEDGESKIIFYYDIGEHKAWEQPSLHCSTSTWKMIERY